MKQYHICDDCNKFRVCDFKTGLCFDCTPIEIKITFGEDND